MSIRSILPFLCIAVHVSAAYGSIPGNNFQRIDDFEKYFQENYQETIYIHTDKRYYLTGETAKFKVYCLENLNTTPSKLSKVAYIEILDEENTPKLQAKIELKEGSGYGELYIPTNINSGNFVLRGYTRWMRNFGPDSYFHSMIAIINPFKKLGLPPIPANDEISINFYPESGALIDGVDTKLIYEIEDVNGLPVDLSGRIMANDTILIQEFRPLKNGIGSFYFYPDMNKNYHVELFHTDGDTSKHSFSKMVREGLAMHVSESEDGIMLDIFCNDQTIVSTSDQLYTIVHQKDKINLVKNFALTNSNYAMLIDPSILANGVFGISLFNASGKLIQERKVFKYADIGIKGVMNTNTKRLAQREKLTIDLSRSITDMSAGDNYISISVASRHDQLDHQVLNFENYLLLDNALIGSLYGIESFFQGSTLEVANAINDLLIIHSSTANVWQKIDDEKPIKYIPEYRTPLVTGSLKNMISDDPASGILTYLSIPGKDIRFFSALSKYDGSFIFEVENFYGSNEVVVQNDYTKDTIYAIELENPFSQEYADIDVPALNLDRQMKDWILKQSQNMQIQNAYQKYQPKLTAITQIDSSSFYNEPDSRYYLDDYTRFIVMEEVMREYIANINVRKNQDGFHFMTVDIERNVVYEDNPLMLLDGVPVFDADEIIALDPLKIEKIETVKRRFHLGYLDCQGIVTYTSYQGDLAGYSLNEHALAFEYAGLQTRKQYYFPTYETLFDKRSKVPDFRNTLFWAPTVNLAGNNNSSIDVWTSDYSSSYEIRIEGINKNGEIFSAIENIEVVESLNN